MKRICVCLTLAALLTSLLAGCGGGGDSASAGDDTVPAARMDEPAADAVPAQEPTAGAVPARETAAPDKPVERDAPDDAAGDEIGGEDDESGDEDGVQLGDMLDLNVPLDRGPALYSLLMPEASGLWVEQSDSALIDYSHTEDGYVMVAWLEGGDVKLKVLINGPSGTTYQYNLRADGEFETFPLSDGTGEYTIGVYRNTSGTSYATVLSVTTWAELTDEFAPFLRPNQYINFDEESEAVAKAAELCAGESDNLKKVELVYEYVVNNTTYDKAKAQSVESGYLPDVDETLETGMGICFDYAALMTCMLRSQNVPVKLIVGYTGDAYHAWINVYSEEEGWVTAAIYFNGYEWKLMDPTFASSSNQSDSIMEYIGDGENYTAKYQY